MKVIARAVSSTSTEMTKECAHQPDTPERISQVRELLSEDDQLACDDETVSRFLRAEKGHVKLVCSQPLSSLSHASMTTHAISQHLDSPLFQMKPKACCRRLMSQKMV
jgi:hypothetical protein